MPAQLLNERVRFLDSPEVRGLVRSRLGETPTVRATVGTDDTLLVRSRATTPWRAAEVAKTYAESYVDVRRRQAEAELAAVSNEVRRKADQIRSQLESANEPERTSLVEQLGLFNTRLDQLQPGDHGPGVVGVTPAEPVDDGSRRAWLVAALGAIVGAGAAVSARRAARRDHAVT